MRRVANCQDSWSASTGSVRFRAVVRMARSIWIVVERSLQCSGLPVAESPSLPACSSRSVCTDSGCPDRITQFRRRLHSPTLPDAPIHLFAPIPLPAPRSAVATLQRGRLVKTGKSCSPRHLVALKQHSCDQLLRVTATSRFHLQIGTSLNSPGLIRVSAS